MILGLLKEHGTETRVALLPEIVKTLTDLKVEVLVEQGAGEKRLHRTLITRPQEQKLLHGPTFLSKPKCFCKFSHPLKKIRRKFKKPRYGSVRSIRSGIPTW